MQVELVRAGVADAQQLWEMQIRAFQSLLEKYRDYETSPGAESVGKTVARLQQEGTFYYFICADGEKVGAICVVDPRTGERKRISPLFILPEHQGRGIAQEAIRLCEQLHGSKGWELDTILQEEGNCYLYEKMGYRRREEKRKVNDRLTLVFYEK